MLLENFSKHEGAQSPDLEDASCATTHRLFGSVAFMLRNGQGGGE